MRSRIIILLGILMFLPCFAAAAARDTVSAEPASIEMVFVKGGCFDMGDAFGEGHDAEKPVHEVCVKDFYIGKYEVTQEQWKSITGNNPSFFSSCGINCPVESVSWNDVQDFIRKLNDRTGKFYRLPTEAEWEYAARSGGRKERYAGTNYGPDLERYAWYNYNSNNKTHPVGQREPNGLGLYDMSGNVWEWVSDLSGITYYKISPRDNPQGPSSGGNRVCRGGSWDSVPQLLRTSYRRSLAPVYKDGRRGFRLLLIK